MLELRQRLEDAFAGAAFAEAGELDEAMTMAGVRQCDASASDIFAAVAFAEANCPETALEMLGCAPRRPAPSPVCGFLESVGLGGVHVTYGLAEA